MEFPICPNCGKSDVMIKTRIRGADMDSFGGLVMVEVCCRKCKFPDTMANGAANDTRRYKSLLNGTIGCYNANVRALWKKNPQGLQLPGAGI